VRLLDSQPCDGFFHDFDRRARHELWTILFSPTLTDRRSGEGLQGQNQHLKGFHFLLGPPQVIGESQSIIGANCRGGACGRPPIGKALPALVKTSAASGLQHLAA
jgi:hypothetical protein